ncbi:class II fructose-bisphosphatase [SAR202 cluster bacterium AC-409-J13_OGT_754m]|nr:class II fructose-bisphosphatase [SAR202 cluster bacterium AC-409-J13_OGT_754m]
MNSVLGNELLKVTQAAAISAVRYKGMGDKELVDQAAVDAMRSTLANVDMDGIVVIGEGEKDEAPMLYIGERLGNGFGPVVDVAVDPIDGTTLLSKGLPGAISVMAVCSRGEMNCPKSHAYMYKIIVGKKAKSAIDIDDPVAVNLSNIAEALNKDITDLTVVVLDRPRHKDLLLDIKNAGAKIKLIFDGDVMAGLQAALPNSGVDVLMGIGGTPEGVLTAAALRCIGGEIICRAWSKNDEEKQLAVQNGIDLDIVYSTEDLVGKGDVVFVCTGASNGDLVSGVELDNGGALTHSVYMGTDVGGINRVEMYYDKLQIDKLLYA